MYQDFFQHLLQPKFERNPREDAKTEPVSIPSIANNNCFVKTNKKPHQEILGVWELFWRIYQIETTNIFRSETNGKLVKTPTSKPPQKNNNSNCEKENRSNRLQKRFGVWEHLWQIHQNETASIPKQETHSIWELFWRIRQNETASISNQETHSIWENFWRIHQNETASISKQETHSIWEHFWQIHQNKTASISKQQTHNIWEHFSPIYQNKTASISKQQTHSIWEHFSSIHQNKTASIYKQEAHSKLGKIQSSKPLKKNSNRNWVKENSSKPPQTRFGVWEHIWQIHQIERVTDTIPRPENNRNDHGRTKNSKPRKDRLGVWEHIQGMSLPWNTKSGEQARKVESKQLEVVDSEFSMPSFTPYMAKLPWHRGPRAFLSQLFPRYGNYCGPNWSSGKDRGDLFWDKKPIDWLDYCCYCHDIGYDTHDQAEMLKADIAFLECLEKNQTKTKGNPLIAEAYISMCITGLRNILIPYRKQLSKPMQVKNILVSKISGSNSRNNVVQHQ